MNYTKLSLPEVMKTLDATAQDAHTRFGSLDERQLNWRPDPARWSIGQCFDHLLKADALLLKAAEAALGNPPRSVWRRLPMLPTAFGWLLIRSQSSKTRGKFSAPALAQPTTSQIPGDVIQRFVDQQRQAEQWVRGLDPARVSRVIMVSPFVKVVTYSVLDGLRLLVAHDRRHFEQAQAVMLSPMFSNG